MLVSELESPYYANAFLLHRCDQFRVANDGNHVLDHKGLDLLLLQKA